MILCRPPNIEIAQRTQALLETEINETLWTGLVLITGSGRCLIMPVPFVYMLHRVADGN